MTLEEYAVEKIKEFCATQNYALNTLDGVRINFTNGWALVRASNTGPNLTVRAEATDEASMTRLKDFILQLIEVYKKELE